MVQENDRLKICFLGSFCMKIGDKHIAADSWKSKKALTLFKYIISKNKKVPKDILMDLLWPDCYQDQTHNLHTTIYYLRKKIKTVVSGNIDPIKYSKGLYWFEKGDYCWLDYEEFEAIYRKGIRFLEQNDYQSAKELFKKAITLYQGDFLQDDLYIDWTFGPRNYYRELFIDTIIRYSSLLAEQYQDYITAIDICQLGIEIDPYQEELHQAKISYLLKLGMYVEATRQYQVYSQMLYEEFGLKPDPEINQKFLKLTNLENKEIDLFTSASKNKTSPGPFICDGQTFQLLYELQKRRQKRSEEEFTILKVVDNEEDEHKKRRIIMVLQNSLRRGDVLCNWDSNTFLLLLSDTGEEKSGVVKDRIERVLNNKKISHIEITIEVITGSKEHREQDERQIN